MSVLGSTYSTVTVDTITNHRNISNRFIFILQVKCDITVIGVKEYVLIHDSMTVSPTSSIEGARQTHYYSKQDRIEIGLV